MKAAARVDDGRVNVGATCSDEAIFRINPLN